MEPEDYLPSIIDWVRDHHQWDVKREWIRFIPGIVKGIGLVVNVFTQPDEKSSSSHPFITHSASPQRVMAERWSSIR